MWWRPHWKDCRGIPDIWAKELDRFNEILGPYSFRRGSPTAGCLGPDFSVFETPASRMWRQRWRNRTLGYRRTVSRSFISLDLRSSTSRKNPWAAIEAFRQACWQRARHPTLISSSEGFNSGEFDRQSAGEIKLTKSLQFRDRVIVIDKTLTTNEIRNLVRCCDCFLSLHRSEGFGRGPAEAMFFGKPVIATGWSGNMEYMNDDVAFSIRYTLQPVKEGEYPHFEDQVWAEADVSHAAEILIRLVDDPALRRAVGSRAQQHMQREFSDAVLGASYRRRIEAILRRSRPDVP